MYLEMEDTGNAILKGYRECDTEQEVLSTCDEILVFLIYL